MICLISYLWQREKLPPDAYMQLNSAVDKMDIENDRIKKENKIYDNIVSEIANAIAQKEGGKPEEYIAYATALSLNDILRKIEVQSAM